MVFQHPDCAYFTAGEEEVEMVAEEIEEGIPTR
jgi:hypothetical protein